MNHNMHETYPPGMSKLRNYGLGLMIKTWSAPRSAHTYLSYYDLLSSDDVYCGLCSEKSQNYAVCPKGDVSCNSAANKEIDPEYFAMKFLNSTCFTNYWLTSQVELKPQWKMISKDPKSGSLRIT